MISALAFALTGATLVGIGTFGLIAGRHLLRQILAFNILGGGIFLMLGAMTRGDPVPKALIITGIVVALAATALAVTLALRLLERTGSTELPDLEEDPDG